MEQTMYTHMQKVENGHWWFRARQEILIDLLGHWGRLEEGKRILDIGCGTGNMLCALSKYPVKAEGRDFSEDSLRICRERGLNVQKGTLPETLNLTEPVDTVLLLDVLEHVKEDREALRIIREAVKPDGRLILTVPAHPSLWSEHDVRNHHYRRYTGRKLVHLFRQTGWEIEFMSPYNTFLYPAAVGVRYLKRILNLSVDEIKIPSPVVNEIFYTLFRAEGSLLKRHIPFPFGLSYITVLKKQ